MCYSSLYPQHLALCLIHSKHAINIEERKKEKEGKDRNQERRRKEERKEEKNENRLDLNL